MTLTVERQEDEEKTWKVTSFTTAPVTEEPAAEGTTGAAEGSAEGTTEATTAAGN